MSNDYASPNDDYDCVERLHAELLKIRLLSNNNNKLKN